MNISTFNSDLKDYQILLLFAFISVLSLFIYGIDAGSHHTYNVFYHHIFSNPNKFLGTPLELMLASQGAKLFTISLASVLLDPFRVIVIAILCNTVILFVSFHISRIFLEYKHALLLTIILGLVASSPLVGFHDSELIFNRKTATVTFLLVCFLFYLRERYFVAGLFAAGALFLHPTNALTALIFFLPGFAVFVCRARTKTLPALLVSLVPPLLVITFTYISSQTISPGNYQSSVTEWYKYSVLLEADDVTMAWKLQHGAPYLIPLLLTSFGVSTLFTFRGDTPKDSPLGWICITHLPLVLLSIALEFSQIRGFQLGIVSELFSSIQLRRGIWVPMLSACLLLQLYIIQVPKNSRRIWLFAFTIAVILDHTPLSILIFLFLAAFLFREKTVILSIFFSIVGVAWYVTANAGELISTHEFIHVLFVVGLIIVFFLIYRHRGLQLAIVSILLFHSTIVLVNNNFRHDVFLNSYNYIFSPQDILNQHANEELEVLIALNDIEKQKNSTILFSPFALGYSASIISQRPILFSRWENTLMFSKILYERFVDKMADVGVPLTVCNKDGTSNMLCVLDAVGQKIDTLTEEEIMRISDKHNIGFIVKKGSLPGRIPVFSNKRFSVYQLHDN